ncbi:outer dynein arm-docking complex subunit 1-like isoform 4-T6 [Menidia menidia]
MPVFQKPSSKIQKWKEGALEKSQSRPEADLHKLQRQHRRMEGARRASIGQTRGLIIRDRREIQQLWDERQELSRSLRISQSGYHQWTDATVLQDLHAKVACGDRLDDELEAEKNKATSLKDQILELERKLAEQKNRGDSSCCIWKLDKSSFIRTTRVMENRLHRGNKCLNDQMTKNGELREELKTLQMERSKFLHVKFQLGKVCLVLLTCFHNFP